MCHDLKIRQPQCSDFKILCLECSGALVPEVSKCVTLLQLVSAATPIAYSKLSPLKHTHVFGLTAYFDTWYHFVGTLNSHKFLKFCEKCLLISERKTDKYFTAVTAVISQVADVSHSPHTCSKFRWNGCVGLFARNVFVGAPGQEACICSIGLKGAPIWTRYRVGHSNSFTLMTDGFTIKIKCNWLHNNCDDHCIKELS